SLTPSHRRRSKRSPKAFFAPPRRANATPRSSQGWLCWNSRSLRGLDRTFRRVRSRFSSLFVHNERSKEMPVYRLPRGGATMTTATGLTELPEVAKVLVVED